MQLIEDTFNIYIFGVWIYKQIK